MFFAAFLFSFLTSCAEIYAGEPDLTDEVDKTIIVEAHKNLELYVAPVVVSNTSTFVEGNVNNNSVFGYASLHYKNAKIPNERGAYEQITVSGQKMYVYNSETIKFAWDNCNYKRDPKLCASTNDHYLLETYVLINDEQLVITQQLFNPEMQIVNQGTVTDTKVIRWIKQQALKVQTGQGIPQGANCTGNSCSLDPRGLQNFVPQQQSTVIEKPLEKLPLKWEIPHRLLEKHFHQVSMRVWVGVKLY